MYLLPKIHKSLSNVPGRTLGHQKRKPIMQSSKSCIKDSGDFIRKIKFIQFILSNVIFVTADMVGLYPSIPQDSGLQDTINPYNYLFLLKSYVVLDSRFEQVVLSI